MISFYEWVAPVGQLFLLDSVVELASYCTFRVVPGAVEVRILIREANYNLSD